MGLAPLGLPPWAQSTYMAGRAGRGGPGAPQGPGAVRRRPPADPGGPREDYPQPERLQCSHRVVGIHTAPCTRPKTLCGRHWGKAIVFSLLLGGLVSMDPNFGVTSKQAGSEVHITWTRPEECSPSPLSREPRRWPEAGWGRGCCPLEAGKETSLSSSTVRVHGKLH